jgi:hypothetical protein
MSAAISNISEEVVECSRCTEPEIGFSAITVALIVILATILVYYLVCLGSNIVRKVREGFISPQAYEVCAQSRDMFTKSNGGTTYSEYKSALHGADPVQFDEIKKLWKKGELTPANVQKAL